MPAALYPKTVKLEYLPSNGQPLKEITDVLLCFDCEQCFNRRGESEVLRYIAAKIAKKPIPLVAKLEPSIVQEGDKTLKSYDGSEIGLNMDMFAYFALSMAWRGTHSWPICGSKHTTPIRLGFYEEPIRRFLAEETMDFPSETSVIVIVCTDKESREAWFLPTQCDDVWFHDIRVLALGLFFRVVLGRSIPDVLKTDSCHADGKRIHLGDASEKTRQALAYTESLSC